MNFLFMLCCVLLLRKGLKRSQYKSCLEVACICFSLFKSQISFKCIKILIFRYFELWDKNNTKCRFGQWLLYTLRSQAMLMCRAVSDIFCCCYLKGGFGFNTSAKLIGLHVCGVLYHDLNNVL